MPAHWLSRHLTFAAIVVGTLGYTTMAAGQNCDPREIWNLRHSQRTLQDLQVTIEVRFITVSDAFFERVGIDFNFNPTTAPCDPEYNGTGDPFPTGANPTPLPNPFDQPNLLRYPAQAGTTFALFQLNSDDEKDRFLQAVFAEPAALVHRVVTEVVDGDVITVDHPANQPLLFGTWKMPGMGMTLKTGITSNGENVWVSALPFYHGIIPANTFSTNAGEREFQAGDPLAEVPDNPRVLARTSTSVTVPDGGTLVLGGFYRQPVQSDRVSNQLARLPIVNRLFRNVGLQPTDRHVMLMITPRIIIQEE